MQLVWAWQWNPTRGHPKGAYILGLPGPFWNHFGIILELCLNHFGIMLESFWNRLESFWNHFGIILESFRIHFRSFRFSTFSTFFGGASIGGSRPAPLLRALYGAHFPGYRYRYRYRYRCQREEGFSPKTIKEKGGEEMFFEGVPKVYNESISETGSSLW